MTAERRVLIWSREPDSPTTHTLQRPSLPLSLFLMLPNA